MPVKKKSTRAKQETSCRSETGESDQPARPPRPAAAKREIGGAIGREQILTKYWELANLDPEVTKGTIAGQLKALDSLREELGLTPAEAKSEAPKNVREIYRSAWMRQAGNKAANE